MDLDELQKTIAKIVRDLSDACDTVNEENGDEALLDLLGKAHAASCEAKWRVKHLAKVERV